MGFQPMFDHGLKARATQSCHEKMPTLSDNLTPVLAGLKEWHTVCDALAEGRAVALIRKGGILEAKTGFAPQHDRFVLLPTLYHEHESAGLDPQHAPRPDRAELLCDVVDLITLKPEASLAALKGLHGYTPEQLHTRQSYRPKLPLHVMIVSVRRLQQPLLLAGVDVAGCKSWATLPENTVVDTTQPITSIDAARSAAHDLRERMHSELWTS
jgi:hypothetical protein